MAHPPANDEEPQDEQDEELPQIEQKRRRTELSSTLQAFSNVQRQIAALDLSALRSTSRLLEHSTVIEVARAAAAQAALADHFANSIDFKALDLAQALRDDVNTKTTLYQPPAWLNTLNLVELNLALGSAADLMEATQSTRTAIEMVTRQSNLLGDIAKQWEAIRSTVGFAASLHDLDRFIPTNLRSFDDLDSIAAVALSEGIPLAWVPNAQIVQALVEAPSAEEREKILLDHRGNILDDCESVLANRPSEWAAECRNAIGALRAGFHAPAQSHAANIIDSIVLARLGKDGRTAAQARAQEDYGDTPLRVVSENLALRPLFKAFERWYPHWGTPPPKGFGRHLTAHAVGHAGVFAPPSALIATMLATSLTVQYTAVDTDDSAEGNPEDN